MMKEIERIFEEHADHSGRIYRYDFPKLAKAIEQKYVSRDRVRNYLKKLCWEDKDTEELLLLVFAMVEANDGY
jgi:hypothetical protein